MLLTKALGLHGLKQLKGPSAGIVHSVWATDLSCIGNKTPADMSYFSTGEVCSVGLARKLHMEKSHFSRQKE